MAIVMRRMTWAMIVAALMVVHAACQSNDSPPPTPGVAMAQKEVLTLDQVITLGDIDADEPAKKVKRFQPLADFLAEHLQGYGIQAGRVVIARDIDEIGRFLRDGTVDLYFDSAFPALGAQELSGSEFILRRSKKGESSYWSTFVALKDSGVSSVEDFVGKVVTFENPQSTSGFVLPAGTLIRRGFTLREVDGPDAAVAPDEIGYFFSRDEENTFDLVLRGRVAAGGISIHDYEGLPEELQQQLRLIDRTITLPRQIVSVRPGLDPDLVGKLRGLLTGLALSEEGRQILKGMKDSNFDELPSGYEATLRELKELMLLVSKG